MIESVPSNMLREVKKRIEPIQYNVRRAERERLQKYRRRYNSGVESDKKKFRVCF